MGNPSQRQGCRQENGPPLGAAEATSGSEVMGAGMGWRWMAEASPMGSGLASAPGQKPSCAPLGRSPEHRWLCDRVEAKAFSPAINHEVLAAALDFPSRLAGGDLGAHDSPG